MENQSYIAKVLSRSKETPYASDKMLYEAFIHDLQGDVIRLNQRWEIDSTKADIMLKITQDAIL